MSPFLRFVAALVGAALLAAALPASGQFDGWSLFPPLVAILVAAITGHLVLGLFTALLGAAVLSLAPTTPLDQLPWAALNPALRTAAADTSHPPVQDY